jgi:FMN-dependent NADH-azoreductase
MFAMKISIISASHRINSQSKKISDLLHNNFIKYKSDLEIFSLDLADAVLPLWSPEKKMAKVFGEKLGVQYQIN